MKIHKMLVMSFFGVAMLTFSGCASMELTNRDKDLQNLKLGAIKGNGEHIEAKNSGLYFCGLPIFSGATAAPGYTAWFKDTVNVDSVLDMVTVKAKEIRANYVLDITTTHTPPYWFFYINTVTVSANLVN
ncbi:MAG: hypothetical protein RRY34_09890 [Victivallaceae bacterium]